MGALLGHLRVKLKSLIFVCVGAEGGGVSVKQDHKQIIHSYTVI